MWAIMASCKQNIMQASCSKLPDLYLWFRCIMPTLNVNYICVVYLCGVFSIFELFLINVLTYFQSIIHRSLININSSIYRTLFSFTCTIQTTFCCWANVLTACNKIIWQQQWSQTITAVSSTKVTDIDFGNEFASAKFSVVKLHCSVFTSDLCFWNAFTFLK